MFGECEMPSQTERIEEIRVKRTSHGYFTLNFTIRFTPAVKRI